MKLKFNFGVLKGQDILFSFKRDDGTQCNVKIENIEKVQQTNIGYTFYGINGSLFIHKSKFIHMWLEYWRGDWRFYEGRVSDINCFVGFTMFDVYGFPVELTEEILSEQGYILDMNGFQILRDLQREMNKSTFKNKDAFQ